MLKQELSFRSLFEKIDYISNETAFKILELSQHQTPNITTLSKKVNLKYNKCSDYVREMEKLGLIKKRRNGKEVLVKARISLAKLQIFFND